MVSIIEEQVKVYRPMFIAHGDSPKSTGWPDRNAQLLRFEKLIDNFLDSMELITIEDIGCGICDLYPYLKSKNLKFSYSGTEIVPEMVVFAREKYPEICVKNRNIILDSVYDKYDYVVCSGLFNKPGEVDFYEWEKFSYDLINRMYEMCNKGISFNFLTTHRTFTDPTLHYFNPSEVLDFCFKNLSRFISVQHNYPLYECTITVFREEEIGFRYRNRGFDKYFNT